MGSVAHGIALCIERKRSEEALGASEFKYQSVVENIKEVIFQVDQQGRFLFLNRRLITPSQSEQPQSA